MTKKDELLYPVTKKTFHKYAKTIFDPMRRGESVTTVWVPMAGRRMWNKFLIENIGLFKKELPEYEKYLLVYIEPLDLTEESLSGYLRLMGKSFIDVAKKNAGLKQRVDLDSNYKIFDDDNASYSKLLDVLKTMLGEVVEAGFGITFFLGEFDELDFVNKVFFNNLKSLWSRLYPSLHYVFLLRERVTREENISRWGELNEAVMQNVIYVPLRSRSDFDYLVDYFSNQLNLDLSDSEKSILWRLCGGHPYLIKVALRVMSRSRKRVEANELESLLLGYYELKSVSRGILRVRSESEIAVLRKIINGDEVGGNESEIVDFFLMLGLIKGEKGRYKVFCRLFEDAVSNEGGKVRTYKSDDKYLELDQESGAIMLNGKTVEELFTRQEYALLSMFLSEKGKLCSRDDVGDALWGKESYEKYSDWAIDQVISKLRKKLRGEKIKDKLVTVRGKGYKLIV